MQVFFVTSDAAVFALCPVAPFHAPVSLSAVDHLQESAQQQQGSVAHSTTRAWLAQVMLVLLPTLLKCTNSCYTEKQYNQV